MKKLFTITVILAILFSCKEKEELINNEDILKKNKEWIKAQKNNSGTVLCTKIKFTGDSIKQTEWTYSNESDFYSDKNAVKTTNYKNFTYIIVGDTIYTKYIYSAGTWSEKYFYSVNTDSLILKGKINSVLDYQAKGDKYYSIRKL